MALWSPSGCLDVPPLITIDVDPSRYRFSVHYFREERLDQPLDILEWQRRTGHHLIFNAGLFRENYAYLGLLYANGRSLGGRQHATWLGLFAAEPTIGGTPPAKIFDLAVEAFDEQRPPYREAAQSLMLLDQNGTIRVRQTGKHSHQTIVGEQDNGHIVLFKTTRPASLYDLGQCIHVEFPAVRRAMAMDGGSSSDMVLAPSLSRNAGKVGETSASAALLNQNQSGHIPLPAVIGISPRGDKAAK
ncbi:MAG TPA: phosphodiester glycosidase family protein [Nitrospira sp.]|nr:phosphodiester glycosidase family protein [Nitrospira sp.]